METPAPVEDEFEFLFRKAATNKNLEQVKTASGDCGGDESALRRGSLPTAVRRIQQEEECFLPSKSAADPPHQHHQRASSCKSPSKSKSKMAATTGSPKNRHNDNGFLSPLAAGGRDAEKSQSPSVSSSRSGSFRRMSRPRSIRDFQEAYSDAATTSSSGGGERRRSSGNLEETVAAKLRELKNLEDENCLVVRQFTTSPQGHIVNRVDSFKRKHAAHQIPEKFVASRGAANETVEKTNDAPETPSRMTSCGDRAHEVLILGDRRVGKTALITQFMTSEYLAALDTSFDGDTANEKTISVSVDGIETTLYLTEIETDSKQDLKKTHPGVDCYILLCSVVDRKSFDYISDVLRDLDETRSFAVIVVANKSDVVRKRQVSEAEAKDICCQLSAKYIEVSAALNHRIDELLVGLVSQVRLNLKRRERLDAAIARGGGGGIEMAAVDEPPTPTNVPCSGGPRSFFRRLFGRQKEERRPCENLLTL